MQAPRYPIRPLKLRKPIKAHYKVNFLALGTVTLNQQSVTSFIKQIRMIAADKDPANIVVTSSYVHGMHAVGIRSNKSQIDPSYFRQLKKYNENKIQYPILMKQYHKDVLQFKKDLKIYQQYNIEQRIKVLSKELNKLKNSK